MFARKIIDVWIAPRIDRQFVEIGSMPVLRIAGRRDQILQAVRIRSHVHFKIAERGFDAAVDVRPRRDVTRAFAATRDARNDQRRQNADDDDDQHQFRQRKTATGFILLNYDSFAFDFERSGRYTSGKN